MIKQQGLSLLELMIALALSVIIFLSIDSIYAGLWQTRASLQKEQEMQRGRQLIHSVFAEKIFHAGYLGCRALRDGLRIHAPARLPLDFFIQEGKSWKLQQQAFMLHETFDQGIQLNEPLVEQSRLAPAELSEKSDWLLVSDCDSAELVPFAGQIVQSYKPPVYIFPVIIKRWYVKNQTIYAQQVYPPQQAQPMHTPADPWLWEQQGSLLHLLWQGDQWVFELGNN